jgi:sugar phosphate isomerase/epimerase
LIDDTKAARHGYPFRLGCTSYVYPGDIPFNAERLAPMFDDIELVFFQSSDACSHACNFPDAATITLLKRLRDTYGTSYTVHFPIDKKAGAADASERDGFFNQVKALVDLTGPLEPYGYILHLEGIHRQSSEAEKQQWQECAYRTCERIVSIQGLDPARICVENLDYPLSWHTKMVHEFGFSLCLDLGHLFLYKEDIGGTISGFLADVRVIHLHGVCEGKDHISLKKHDYSQLVPVVREKLSEFSGVVTLETFNEQDTFESVETIKKIWQK